MNCPNCQTELPPDAAFCHECGTRVAGPDQNTNVPPGHSVDDGTDYIAGGTLYEPVASEGASTDLKPGDVFDNRYTIDSTLGSGAMGVVYKATDTNNNRAVALKLIHGRYLTDPSAADRLIAEGLMTQDQLKHPNIVTVYDVSRSGNQAYVAMEFVDGQSLRAWFSKQRSANAEVSVKTASGIINAVLDGLEAAHNAGIVHRDIKPENIMLLGEPNEGDFRLRILDFGIAKALGPSAFADAVRLGSPDYMAPEQKNMPEAVEPSADLYSLARILYELLMEVRPEGGFQPPSKYRSDVPATMDTLLEKALSLRPRSRHQSVEEFRAALSGTDTGANTQTDKTTADNIKDKIKDTYVGGANDDVEVTNIFGKKKTFKRWYVWLCLGAAALVGILLASPDFWEGVNQSGSGTSSSTTQNWGNTDTHEDVKSLIEDDEIIGGDGTTAPPPASQIWFDDFGNVFDIVIDGSTIRGDGAVDGFPVTLQGTFAGGALEMTLAYPSSGAVILLSGQQTNAAHINFQGINPNGLGFTGAFHICHRPGQEGVNLC